jgi:tubulin-specific chaperone D
MSEETEQLFITFAKRKEFENLQNELLAVDLYTQPTPDEDLRERFIVDMHLWAIVSFINLAIYFILKVCYNQFAEYQEQPYLLDPYLEDLIGAVVRPLKTFAAEFNKHGSSWKGQSYIRISRLSTLLYMYIKFRGHKTISRCSFVGLKAKYQYTVSVRYFPHEVADLSIALDFILAPDSPTQQNWQWELRYVVLLWLSLIVRIPFDLSLFDPENQPHKSANALQSVGEKYMSKAGPERTAAALLLSRLFMRYNRTPIHFGG